VNHIVLGRRHGVTVDKLAPLSYRVSFKSKSVIFDLNDLSTVAPPSAALGPDEKYLGPVFDDSAIRFFLLYNTRLKIFHYVLDETIRVADEFFAAKSTDRIAIGRRTGFAFYRDHRLDRKILIGVFEGNARVNNYFDGPFDQLPDNFLVGDTLRRIILEVEPSLAGRIDRFGGSPDGSSRFLIAPYLHYRAMFSTPAPPTRRSSRIFTTPASSSIQTAMARRRLCRTSRTRSGRQSRGTGPRTRARRGTKSRFQSN
jgi:hypothetical protein